MNLNFSIFSKLLSSTPARMIGGLLALAFLFLQAYSLPPVEAGSQLIVFSIFGQLQQVPWWICFSAEFICIAISLLLILKINANHRFVDGPSFPLSVFVIIGISSYPQVLLQPEVIFTTLMGLIVIYLLLEIYNRSNVSGIIFQSASICSVASLFYPPSVILLLLILIAVSIFRPLNLRSFFLILIGFALLYFYLFSLSYIFNWQLNLALNRDLQFTGTITGLFNSNNFGLSGMFVLSVIAMGRLYSKRQKLIVRQRNQLVVIFMAFLFYFGIGLLFGFAESLVMLFCLSSIFFLFFYHSITKKWIVDAVLFIILGYNSFVTIFN